MSANESAPDPPARVDSPQLAAANALALTPDSIIIAVMGITGCGKTTFVNHFANSPLRVGHTLDSCTQEVQVAACTLENGRLIYLVDTPGYNDTNRSDTEILRQVSAWLTAAHTEKIRLSGIIYLHSIMDNRVGGTGVRNLKMFRRLCGDQNLGGVVLATTMWGVTDKTKAMQREKELRTDEKYWAPLIKQEAKVLRQDEGKTSGRKIIKYLLARKKKMVLEIQTELVDKNMSLEQTGAGSELVTMLEKRIQEYQKNIEDIERELATMTGKYSEVKQNLEDARDEWSEKFAASQAEIKRLQVSNGQIVAEEAKKIRTKYLKGIHDNACAVM